MIISFKTIIQYYNQDVDFDINHTTEYFHHQRDPSSYTFIDKPIYPTSHPHPLLKH